MKATISSSGKLHGLVMPMKKSSQVCNKMRPRHEGYNLLKWQVPWFGPAHEENFTSTWNGNPMGVVWSTTLIPSPSLGSKTHATLIPYCALVSLRC